MNQEGRVISMMSIGSTDIILSKISLPKFPDYSYRKIGRRAWTGPDSTSVSEDPISRGAKGNDRTRNKQSKASEDPISRGAKGNDRTRNKQSKASEDLQTKRLETEEFFSMFMSFHLLISVFKPPVLILETGGRYLDNEMTRDMNMRQQEKRLETEVSFVRFFTSYMYISVFKPPIQFLTQRGENSMRQIIIKADTPEEMREIRDDLHNQLKGLESYIASNIVLNDSDDRCDGTTNEVHVYLSANLTYTPKFLI